MGRGTMRRITPAALCCAIAVLIAGSIVPATGAAATTPLPVVDRQEQALITFINAYRKKRHLPPVVVDVRLQRAAEWMALDMQRHNKLDHTDSKKRRFDIRLRAFRYPTRTTRAGENIAHGRIQAKSTYSDWIHSPLHRANIGNRAWRAIGLARVCVPRTGKSADCWWVADFGAKLTVSMPKPKPPTSDPVTDSGPSA